MALASQSYQIKRRPRIRHQLSDIHSVLADIYAARDVVEPAQLNMGLENMLSPSLLSGIDEAAGILVDAIEAQARILFIGDFDADGATSCAVGVLALTKMGLHNVDYLVPNRFEYGYGLTPEIVGVAAGYQPDLLITVDKGIASIDGVTVARELGLSVIITDHHLPGPELPAADAIINPNQAGDRFPSKALSGVGVVFYLMVALRAALRESGWFKRADLPVPNLAELLDLVALGTVADLVPLDYNNRILVAQGLARIRKGTCRCGIRALLERGKRSINSANASDLAFTVAPRLNAAGRLEDMSLGIECLITNDMDHARRIACQLDDLNQQRRVIEAEMQSQAEASLASVKSGAQLLDAGLCLYDESWHQGVVGLIASKIKERTNRPTVVFAPGDNDELKGSARSVPGLHIRDLLDGIATEHPDLLTKFGGHAMAAGLSLAPHNFERFSSVFSEHVRAVIGDESEQSALLSDGDLSEEDLGLELAEQIRISGPWGQGFPEPVFDDEFEVLEQKTVGEEHLKLRVRKIGGKKNFDAIAFRWLRHGFVPETGSFVHLLYRLDVNDYQGVRTPQLIVEHLQPVLESRDG